MSYHHSTPSESRSSSIRAGISLLPHSETIPSDARSPEHARPMNSAYAGGIDCEFRAVHPFAAIAARLISDAEIRVRGLWRCARTRAHDGVPMAAYRDQVARVTADRRVQHEPRQLERLVPGDGQPEMTAAEDEIGSRAAARSRWSMAVPSLQHVTDRRYEIGIRCAVAAIVGHTLSSISGTAARSQMKSSRTDRTADAARRPRTKRNG